MSHAVVFPTQTRSEGKSGCDLPFILEIRHVEVATQAMAAPRSNEANFIQRRSDHVGFAPEAQGVIRRLALIKPYAPVLHAHLEGVPSVSPNQIVNQTVSRPYLDVRSIVVQTDEGSICIHSKWKRARLRIVVGRAVDIELCFVEKIGGES